MSVKVTFCLFCHNQAPFVRQALEGAMAQVYPDLEIVVTDDASTDDTFEQVRATVERYRGPHRVLVRRHPAAVGLAEGINQVMALAAGEFIVVAAGDDVSYPVRCARLMEAWLNHGRRYHFLHSGFRRIDETGQTLGLSALERQLQAQAGPVVQQPSLEEAIRRFVPHPYGCTAAWDRTLFDRFGPLKSRVVQEDVVLGMRGLLTGGVLFLPDQLVDYRLHSRNIYHADVRQAAGGEVSDRQELARLEAYKLRNLTYKDAIYDNFAADVASAARGGLVADSAATALAALIRNRRMRARAEIALRTAGWTARAAALGRLWRLDRRVSFGEICRLLPKPLYERFRLALHSRRPDSAGPA